jgi:nucleoporin NUP42
MTVQGNKNQSEKASPSVNATNQGSSLFGNAAPAFSSSGSAFGQAPSGTTDLKTTPQQNPFSNAPSAFGGSSNSAFGAQSATQPSTTSASGFGTTNTTTSNVFESLAATNAAQNGGGFFGAPPASAFGSLSAPGSVFSNGPSSQDVAQNHQAEGSPPEELAVSTTRVEYVQGSNQEDPPDLSRLGDSLLAAFKATKFDLGKVPDIIPPLEYR